MAAFLYKASAASVLILTQLSKVVCVPVLNVTMPTPSLFLVSVCVSVFDI